jgi:hypothetical protein
MRHGFNVLSTVGEAAAFLEAIINERFQDAPGRYQAGPCRRQRQQRSVIASFRWFTSGVQAQGDGADPCSFSYPRRPRRQGFRAPGFRPPIRQFDHSQEHPPLAGGL